MITLLIDGDPIAYKAVHSANSRAEDPGPLAGQMIDKLVRELNATRAIVAVSDRSRRYWRHDLDPAYKAGRPAPPDNIETARAGLAGRRGVVKELAMLEADDIIGILATSPDVRGRKIIVATDEHMMTIPGEHHRPGKCRPGQTVQVSAAEAECRHLQQTMASTLDRVGLPTAEKLITLYDYISSPIGAWRKVVREFRARGHSDWDALKAARIARVCRVNEFNLETLSVVPWEPPKAPYSVSYEAPPAAAAPTASADRVHASLYDDDGPKHPWT
ncbi:MAG TPA: hypothetical protein VF595_16115 [Tepidisphaeraceae bacterium]|jgi:DNA polymerase-1